MVKLRAHWPYILALCLLTIFLTRNIWGTRAWIETHDGIFHVIRLEAFVDALKSGQFPVRWAGNLDNGFGLPLFNYVYPGPYYLGAPLLLIGLSAKWAIKLISLGFYFFGGLGVYALFAKVSRSRALFAALIFLTTPYLMLNLFVRGALGEFMAICLLPWVILSLYDLNKSNKLLWYHPLAYFGLFLSHNFLSFLFLPLYLLLILRQSRHTQIKAVTSLVISTLLAGFFLFPFIFESSLIYSGAAANFTYNFADHFLYPLQLIWSRWGSGHSVAGAGDGLSFQLGIANLLLLGIAIWLWLKHKGSHHLRFWLVTVLTSLFMLLPLALPLWRLFFPIQIIQFPWRLLALFTIASPMIAFYVAPRKSLMIFLGIIALGFGFYFSTPPYFQNNEQFATQMYVHRFKTTTSSRLELLPRWAPRTEKWKGDEEIRIASGNAELKLMSTNSSGLTVSSTTSDFDTTYLIRRNYFPSWTAQNEKGETLPLSISPDGEIIFRPAQGNHIYHIFVSSTQVETLGNLLSLLGSILILGLIIRPWLKRYLDSHFDGWDISIALRYLPIVTELKRISHPSDKILEIGSEIHGITTYYPRRVTGLDRGFDYTKQNRYLKPVIGSATHLPFQANSFDYVISVDCLEHVPTKLRAQAVKEMLRVATQKVYLTFPVGSASQDIDRRLDQYFYLRNGSHFGYLTEHVKNGLPPFDYIPQLLAHNHKWSYTVSGNTSNWLWTILLKMGLSNTPWQTSIYRRLLLFLPILKHCNFGPCYRQLYILTRIKS
ncbi:MAG: methyltransferase domain-containing protein [bacterium]